MPLPFDTIATPTAVSLAPGAVWLRGWLTSGEQAALVAECRALMDGPAGGYVPTVRGGGTMRVRMVCLGRHWNARTYTYESTRSDHDNAPVAPMPGDLRGLGARVADAAGYTFAPDGCLISWY